MPDIAGTEENDHLRGTTASETIDGLGGDDWIYGGDDGAVDENGDPLTEPDIINGGDGNDVLIGGRLDDTINGGDGNDIIRDSWFIDEPNQGGFDNDLIDGGAGDDTIIYTSRDSMPVYNVSGGEGYDTFRLVGPSWVDLDMGAASIEAFIADMTWPYPGTINVYAYSQTQGVFIRGGVGENVLIGSNFNDRIIGGYGEFWIDGKDGDDYIVAAAFHSEYYPSSDDYRQINGGAGNDIILGSAGDDNLIGGDGNDYIRGGGGYDGFTGGAGDDVIVAEAGFYFVWGGEGYDKVMFEGSADVTLVITQDPWAGPLELEFVAGSNGDDTLDGTATPYSLTLRGNGGHDLLKGGNAQDHLSGGEGNDRLLGNEGDDVLTGLSGNDILLGQAGADGLLGGEGADRLRGGADRDVMFGGGGADTFLFATGDTAATRSQSDRIADFEQGVDRIDLAGIDAVGATAEDDIFTFIGAEAFSGQAGELRYVQANGCSFVEGDTTGDGIANVVIRIDGLHTLTVDDFAL